MVLSAHFPAKTGHVLDFLIFHVVVLMLLVQSQELLDGRVLSLLQDVHRILHLALRRLSLVADVHVQRLRLGDLARAAHAVQFALWVAVSLFDLDHVDFDLLADLAASRIPGFEAAELVVALVAEGWVHWVHVIAVGLHIGVFLAALPIGCLLALL